MQYTRLFNDKSEFYASARLGYPLELYRYLHSWCAERRCMEQTNADFFNEAYAAVKAIWGNAEQSRKVETDFFLHRKQTIDK